MSSRNNGEQGKPTASPPTADSESEVEDEALGDVDEEEMKKWLSAKYEHSSKNPMKLPLKAPWGLPISDADLEKLKVGFKSRDMEERWDFLIEDPDENGNISIHILRSWLQEDCYVLHIVPKPSNDDSGSAIIQGITWEGNKGGLQCGAEQAKKEAVIVSRFKMHCEFEALPQYPSSDLWKRSEYKRLDAE